MNFTAAIGLKYILQNQTAIMDPIGEASCKTRQVNKASQLTHKPWYENLNESSGEGHWHRPNNHYVRISGQSNALPGNVREVSSGSGGNTENGKI
jgi:hypothetical protein